MKVLIYEQLSPSIIDKIKELGHLVYEVYKDNSNEEELLSACEILIVKSKTIVSKEMINKAKNLKYIIKGGVGIENIDADYAHNLGIHVLNTPDAPIISVAEYVMGLILSISRKIPQADLAFKNGIYDSDLFEGFDLYGKTLGVVGFGRIGREVAKRAMAFGMNVIACDKYLSSSPMQSVQLVPLNQLLPRSDIISFHLTFDPKKDKSIIESQHFELMKDNVILINCAKNGIINEIDLISAINSGKVAAAAIDVLKSDSSLIPLLKNNQKIISTPNIASKTLETNNRISEHIFTIIKGLEQK